MLFTLNNCNNCTLTKKQFPQWLGFLMGTFTFTNTKTRVNTRTELILAGPLHTNLECTITLRQKKLTPKSTTCSIMTGKPSDIQSTFNSNILLFKFQTQYYTHSYCLEFSYVITWVRCKKRYNDVPGFGIYGFMFNQGVSSSKIWIFYFVPLRWSWNIVRILRTINTSACEYPFSDLLRV